MLVVEDGRGDGSRVLSTDNEPDSDAENFDHIQSRKAEQARMREERLPTMENVVRIREKLEKVSLTPKIEDVKSSKEVQMLFSEIAASGGATGCFQVGKRDVHQTQLESLVEHVYTALRPNGNEEEDETSSRPRPRFLVVEFGAGKGLFGRLLCGRLPGTKFVAIDRRKIRSHRQRYGEDSVQVSADLREFDLVEIVDDVVNDLYPDESPDGNATEPVRVVVVAKHLCGPASDAAVRRITEAMTQLRAREAETPSRRLKWEVHLAVLAPCCHPQIGWEDYANEEYLVANEFSTADFSLAKQLIFFSKYRNVLNETDCRSWSLRDDPEAVFKVGKLARRVVEEGRIRALVRDTGFLCPFVIEYVPTTVTPDNLLLILRSPKAMAELGDLIPRGISASKPERGILLSLPLSKPKMRGRQSLPSRVARYVLELRDRHPDAGIGSTITEFTAKRCTVIVTVMSEDIEPALKIFVDDDLILQLQILVYPFVGHVPNVNAVAEKVEERVAELRAQGTESWPARVQTLPRKPCDDDLSKAICEDKCACAFAEKEMALAIEEGRTPPEMVPCDRLSPTQYKSVICTILREDGEWSWAMFPKQIYDPSTRAARGEHRWHLPRLLAAFDEAQQRFGFYPPVPKGTATAGLLVDGDVKFEREAKAFVDIGSVKSIVDGLKPTDGSEPTPVDVMLCDQRDDLEKLLSKLKNDCVPYNCLFMRLRLDDFSFTKRNERQLHRRQGLVAHHLLKEFKTVTMEHLLVDREAERVAFCVR